MSNEHNEEIEIMANDDTLRERTKMINETSSDPCGRDCESKMVRF